MQDQIDDIIKREGGAAETNDPADSGGRTKYGISEKSFPEAWKNGPPTYDQARTLYEKVFVLKDHFQLITDPFLQHQVVDFGVTSGPDTAAKLLQQIVGVETDGIIGPDTANAIAAYPSASVFGVSVPGSVMLNLAFRDARVLFYATAAKKQPKDLKFLLGWLKRAFEFK